MLTHPNKYSRAPLGVQWLRVHLPMQRTQVRSRVQEDPTGCRATNLMRQNYQNLNSLEPVLCDKRNHRTGKPAHHS